MDQYGYSSGGPPGGIPYPPTAGVRSRGPARWRSVVAASMVVLGCLLTPAALAGAWFHFDLMDVDGWVATVTDVADEPAVQEAVADVVAEQVYGVLDADRLFGAFLPEELDVLGDVVGSQGLEELTRELTLQAVSSNAFRGFWAAANRRIHPLLLDAINGEGTVDLTADGVVSLDLGEVTRTVTDLLDSSGVSLPSVFPEELTSGDVAMLDTGPLADAGAVIKALDRLWWLLPVEALAFLLGGVLVAARRSVLVIGLGVGLIVATAAFQAGVALAGAYYLDATDTAGIPHDASAAVWRVVTSDLRLWGWALLAIGAVAVAAGVAARLIGGRGPSAPPPMTAGYPGGPQPPHGLAPTGPPPSR